MMEFKQFNGKLNYLHFTSIQFLLFSYQQNSTRILIQMRQSDWTSYKYTIYEPLVYKYARARNVL